MDAYHAIFQANVTPKHIEERYKESPAALKEWKQLRLAVWRVLDNVRKGVPVERGTMAALLAALLAGLRRAELISKQVGVQQDVSESLDKFLNYFGDGDAALVVATVRAINSAPETWTKLAWEKVSGDPPTITDQNHSLAARGERKPYLQLCLPVGTEPLGMQNLLDDACNNNNCESNN